MQEIIRKKVKNILDSTKIGVSKDFSPEEKKELFEHFERFSLQTATCRNRFFRDGWHEWELRGVIGCMIDYAKSHAEAAGFAVEVERFGIDDPIEPIRTIIQEFYDSIERKSDFCDYMDAVGMSRPTTVSHFNNPSQFAAWEIFGIRRLV